MVCKITKVLYPACAVAQQQWSRPTETERILPLIENVAMATFFHFKKLTLPRCRISGSAVEKEPL